jgi:acylpyruvate hydrolase
MYYATVRSGDESWAARIVDGEAELLPYRDLADAIAADDLASPATGTRNAGEFTYAPVVRPSKIICVGLNYAAHIAETGREAPTHPTLFAKYNDSLCGAFDEIELPPEAERVDWEGELTLVIGRGGRRIPAAAALECIAGYTVANDTSMRDWQRRTLQFLQGKTWDHATPVGPVMATPDEVDHGADLRLTTTLDGQVMQDARTSDLVFGPAHLVSYISTFTRLNPGDLVLTGTPGGVGDARDPRISVRSGQTVSVTIEGIGTLANRFV